MSEWVSEWTDKILEPQPEIRDEMNHLRKLAKYLIVIFDRHAQSCKPIATGARTINMPMKYGTRLRLFCVFKLLEVKCKSVDCDQANQHFYENKSCK